MRRRTVRVASAVALATAGTFAVAVPAQAGRGAPGNLANGLAQLVAPPKATGGTIRANPNARTIRDPAGRVLVDVYARPDATLPGVRQQSEAAGLSVVTQSVDARAFEGFVALSQVKALARAAGVATVARAVRPITNVGAATSQGVHAQRVDRVGPGIDGRGVTVGALSDSFDTATQSLAGGPLTVHAADDIRTGDLPPEGVTVIQDDNLSGLGFDEGRAMLQIVHDIAPAAKECFATADFGRLAFAFFIEALADKAGPCGADIVTDDVVYLDEPMFGDDEISDAIDDVTAKGVSYFSSAENGSEDQAYQAPLRIVAPKGATRGTNIDLKGVDPELYAGGFQDFDPGAGVDIAQSAAIGSSTGEESVGTIDLQWDDPNDPNGPPVGDPLFEADGEITTAAPEARFPFTATAGQTVRAFVDGIPSGSTDFVLDVLDPAGNLLQEVDTDTSPEQAILRAKVAGTYTFVVKGFAGDVGDFHFDIRPVTGPSRTSTDLNVLVFDANGKFVAKSDDLNQLTGTPLEILDLEGRGGLQFVVAKANTDGGSATQLRYQLFEDLQYTEYRQPLAPSTFGHATARGANAVAAYDPFRPFLPESFTSVGGELAIKFDSAGNAFPQPDIRRKPEMAATDGGNTTFFTNDTIQDPDTQENFFGTSAAAPHAAGIAALALQARGGPGSVPPAAMRSLLQRSAFPHDLDPQHVSAQGGGLTITADGESGSERGGVPGSMNDPTVFKVSYSGPGALESLTLDGGGANPTGLAQGMVFDARPFAGIPALGGPPLPDQGFPFTVGSASPGVNPHAIRAEFSDPGVLQANRRQFQRMTVRFPRGDLARGRSVSFGIDRDEVVTAAEIAEDGNSADQLGAGVLFPEGVVVGPGMSYRAVTSTGRVLTGVLRNRIGAGWTAVDGFGYINAQAATSTR
jgi:Subtilase family